MNEKTVSERLGIYSEEVPINGVRVRECAKE